MSDEDIKIKAKIRAKEISEIYHIPENIAYIAILDGVGFGMDECYNIIHKR